MVKVATKPGMSMVLALVVPTTKPWMASVAVPRKVTGISAGTTMHCGSNEYCCAISRTMTLPSASSVVPRLLSTNSPERCSVFTSMVSTREGGMAAQCRPVTTIISTISRDDDADDDRPAPLGRDRDGLGAMRSAGRGGSRAHCTAPRGR